MIKKPPLQNKILYSAVNYKTIFLYGYDTLLFVLTFKGKQFVIISHYKNREREDMRQNTEVTFLFVMFVL